ncbi:RICIN domain-containing protein [Streptomyces sp. M1013]|uniref:RICIN domain-containing protein n=1 Tax=Streptomyces sp. M1013 TaxID=549798 RepID=UPI0009A1E082|nr:RICIN domain-containing protein [Streptomyces sp. M1013]
MLKKIQLAGVLAALALAFCNSTGTVAAAPQADPINTFRNQGTQVCLDHNDSDGVRGFGCHYGVWQQWRVHAWGDGTRRFQNVATGKCLHWSKGLGNDGVYGATCNSSQNQSWYVDHWSEGSLTFRNQLDARYCLDHNFDDGVHMRECNRGAWQKWY